MKIIKVSEENKDKLDSIKIHHRETYNDIIDRLLFVNKKYNPEFKTEGNISEIN